MDKRSSRPELTPAKDQAILVIKAVAIIGVVLHHIGNRRLSPDTLALVDIGPEIFSWVVLAFFACAGWLHGQSETRSPKTIAAFVAHRSKRLLLPFAILTLIYASVWQILACLPIPNIGVKLAPDFGTKLLQSLPWRRDYNPVAEQLYFLPLLFVISVVVHALFKLGGKKTITITCVVTFVAGLVISPNSGNTGWSNGMLLFGGFAYSGGFWFRQAPPHELITMPLGRSCSRQSLSFF